MKDDGKAVRARDPKEPCRDSNLNERLKSPRKDRAAVIIAPSTSPGPDVRVRQP
jgi:hypothetical protein